MKRMKKRAFETWTIHFFSQLPSIFVRCKQPIILRSPMTSAKIYPCDPPWCPKPNRCPMPQEPRRSWPSTAVQRSLRGGLRILRGKTPPRSVNSSDTLHIFAHFYFKSLYLSCTIIQIPLEVLTVDCFMSSWLCLPGLGTATCEL